MHCMIFDHTCCGAVRCIEKDALCYRHRLTIAGKVTGSDMI